MPCKYRGPRRRSGPRPARAPAARGPRARARHGHGLGPRRGLARGAGPRGGGGRARRREARGGAAPPPRAPHRLGRGPPARARDRPPDGHGLRPVGTLSRHRKGTMAGSSSELTMAEEGAEGRSRGRSAGRHDKPVPAWRATEKSARARRGAKAHDASSEPHRRSVRGASGRRVHPRPRPGRGGRHLGDPGPRRGGRRCRLRPRRHDGPALTRHPDVRTASVTGSVETGSAIMAEAATNITEANLLGGEAPAIVVADADLDLAVKAITPSRTLNTGQVCNAAERVFVGRAVRERFLEKLDASMAARRHGDPPGDGPIDGGPSPTRPGSTRSGPWSRAALGGRSAGGRREDRRSRGRAAPSSRPCWSTAGGRWRSSTGRSSARPAGRHPRRPRRGHRPRERHGLRAHLVDPRLDPLHGAQGLPRAAVRRDLGGPGARRGDAGPPRRPRPLGHRRRGRQARPPRARRDPPGPPPDPRLGARDGAAAAAAP